MTVVLDAVEKGYWSAEWRKRPADARQAMAKVRAQLQDVPRMVPVYAHRYLSAGRNTSRHPVLSIHSVNDTIVYGWTWPTTSTKSSGPPTSASLSGGTSSDLPAIGSNSKDEPCDSEQAPISGTDQRTETSSVRPVILQLKRQGGCRNRRREGSSLT